MEVLLVHTFKKNLTSSSNPFIYLVKQFISSKMLCNKNFIKPNSRRQIFKHFHWKLEKKFSSKYLVNYSCSKKCSICFLNQVMWPRSIEKLSHAFEFSAISPVPRCISPAILSEMFPQKIFFELRVERLVFVLFEQLHAIFIA